MVTPMGITEDATADGDGVAGEKAGFNAIRSTTQDGAGVMGEVTDITNLNP